MRRHHDRRWSLAALALLIPLTSPALADDEQGARKTAWPGLRRDGSVLLPNGWTLDPAGRQVLLGDFPVAIAEHPKEPVLAVLHAGYGEHEVVTLDAGKGKVIGRVAIPETFAGLTWSADGARLFVGGGFDDVIYRFDHARGLLSNRATLAYQGGDPEGKPEKAGDDEPLPRAERGAKRPQGCIGGLAISEDGQTLYAANTWAHALARFDAESGKFLGEIDLGAGSYPYALLLDERHERIYVSLWQQAKVAIVDTKVNTVLGHYPTQEHPNEMIAARGGDILYVANANRNTVTVIDTQQGKAVETIGTAIAPEAPSGSTPNALALSDDETVLFVANANTNDVAAINVKEPGRSTPLGFIPVGWYPTSVRVSRDGKTIYAANGKGATSKANRDGPNPLATGVDGKTREYIGGLFHGTLSIIPMPNPARMGEYSRTVYRCSPVDRKAPTAVVGDRPEGNPIPARVGGESPITHCVYIIKENRTYDQVLGDIPEGNGEPDLCLFPERVTPNHHALAREFVLLDNFYVESEVSADGHEWSMGAYATDFVERTWPLSYRGDKRVPYPAEGNLPIAFPSGGYLWDKAKEKGVSYRSYGEFIVNGRTPEDPSHAAVETLEGHFDPKFRGYDLSYPDVRRADRFLDEVKAFEAKGEMPRLIILRLPNDHTSGTRPGAPTTTAMVADNDQALGRVIEGLSKSTFWPHLAIFVVEDDAQNGSDHVDAHRTVALAISPYIKRHAVDSTMYTTASMLRTMELVLGLDPMSQFDASARPMYLAFTAEPDPTPYECRPPGTDLKEVNLATAWGARKSLALDLSAEDRADDLVFNEIIWKSVKGADSPMPPPVRAAFVIPRSDEDNDEDEGKDED